MAELRGQEHQAAERDAWALAAALRGGEKDPGTKHADKLARDLDDAQRRAKSLQLALSGTEADIRNATRVSAEEWIGRLDDRLGDVRDRLVTLVEELAGLIHHREDLRAARRFAAGEDYRLAPGVLNGRPDMKTADMLAALAEDAATVPGLIPDALLEFNPDDWPNTPDPNVSGIGGTGTDLRAREAWRQAQDQWASEHGLDRAGFERLRDRQRAQAVQTPEAVA